MPPFSWERKWIRQAKHRRLMIGRIKVENPIRQLTLLAAKSEEQIPSQGSKLLN
jgi:hypothetical protein